MAVDSVGCQHTNIEGQLPTYSAAMIDYAPYAAATDMMVLQNPANSGIICRVTKIRASGTANTASNMDIYAYIRTALSTGGTSAAVTIAKHDSLNPGPYAAAISYSAAPTLNGTGAVIRADRIAMPGSSLNVAGSYLIFEFGVRGGAQAIRIRPGQQLSISNAGNAVAAGTNLYLTFEWTESVGFNA